MKNGVVCSVARGVFAWVVLLWAGYGWAEDVPPSPQARAFNLDDVVVTSTRTAKLLADTPVRTEVLDQAIIKRLHTRDVRDALRVMPGVQLREIHGKSGEEVQLQGFNGDRVLILVDGLPVSATTGSTVDTSQLATLDIDHIELIPGVSSALYGSAAMGGVINIITRKSESGRYATIAADAGSYGDRQLNSDSVALGQQHLMADGGIDWLGWNWTAGADKRHSEGYDLDKSTYASDGAAGDKTNFSIGAARLWQTGNLDLKLERYDENIDTNIKKNTSGKGIKKEDLTRDRLSLQSSLVAGEDHWSFSYLYEKQDESADQLNIDAAVLLGNLWRESNYHQQKASAQWNRNFSWSGHGLLELTSGLEWFQEGLEQNKDQVSGSLDGIADAASYIGLSDGNYLISTPEVPSESRQSAEWFAQGVAGLTRNFELSSGFRWQYDSDFGGYFAPTLNGRLQWQMGGYQFQWRNSIGSGYRVSNLKERYYEFDHSIYGYVVEGNPDLQPESSRSIQTSLSITDGDAIHLEISAFNNRVTDLIEAAATGETTDSNATVYQYINYDDALMRGYEIAVQNNVFSWLSQRLSFSYLDARDLYNHTPLINRAKHHLKGLWMFDMTAAWSMTVTGEYQGSYFTSVEDDSTSVETAETPGFQRWDIKTDFQVSHKFSIYGGLDNVFDIVRDPADNYDRRPVYGRYGYAGFKYQF